MLPAGTAGFVDHIGIAVADMDQALALYRDLMGLELERLEEVPSEQVQVAMLKLDRTGAVGNRRRTIRSEPAARRRKAG